MRLTTTESLPTLNSKASEIINIDEREEPTYRLEDLNYVELVRDFEEIETFMEKFGGVNYQDKSPRFSTTLNEIKTAMANRDSAEIKENISELQSLIERYLPTRSRNAVVEVQYGNDELKLSGAVEKYLSFSEDLFVDIYNQKGEFVGDVAIKDSVSGHFNAKISMPLDPGIYVAKLNYHNLKVTDFFTVPE